MISTRELTCYDMFIIYFNRVFVACNKHTNIDGKTCNNIPEAVNKLALSAWAILVKLGEINMILISSPNKTQDFITV
jgi:hypothetical protein